MKEVIILFGGTFVLLLPLFINPIRNASNVTSVWKQIAIVLWQLANGTGIRVLEQTFGVSQWSVSHFTDRFLKALLDLEQKRIMAARITIGSSNTRI